MTTDEAATMLAAYDLTGSMSKTGKIVGRHKSNVSRALKKAKAIVAPEPPQLRNEKTDWAAAWGQRESRGLEIVDKRIEDKEAVTWDIMRWTGIAADKRYREEHPESVRGNVINVDARQITVTDQVLTALREAHKLLPTEREKDA